MSKRHNILKHRDMEMIIENNNSVYELKGDFVKSTLHTFQKKFEHIFNKENHLTLYTDGLDCIDVYGIRSIVKLHNYALSKQKHLSIIGLGNQKLFDQLKPIAISKMKNKSPLKTIHVIFMNFKKWF